MPKLRILLADDHVTVREGLKAILNAQPGMTVVAEVADGQAAIDQSQTLMPDVAVMDLSMPNVNGLAATEALQQSCPGVKVVVLTRHLDNGYVQRLFKAGASAYVLKQSRASELLNAIRTVAAGATYFDTRIGDTVIDEVRLADRQQSKFSELSGREEEILRLVAWGYSNKEIAARLSLSVKTVETHKFNGSRKLGLQNRIDVVRFALLRGWLTDA
jgi:DNA-binding NarL/FixJ family response regulator